MTEQLTGDAVPDNVRSLPVTSDSEISTEEKEVRIVGANDLEECTVSTEIPTIIKWLQSIEESSFDWVRLNEEGEIIGCNATVPKGVIKLQGTARKSNQHSSMVSYGPLRGTGGSNDD